jgi:uncharacterized protein (TIGR02145 family)
MIKEKIKFTFYFILVIFLTLGLTISFRPILAIWLDPVNNPTASCVLGDEGCNNLVDTGLIAQIKNGSLYVNNSGLASLGFVLLGRAEINAATSDPSTQLQINASESKEGVRIVSALNWSPLNIQNNLGADIFRVDQSGSLATGTIPLANITNTPAQCASGEYVSDIGSTLVCSKPARNGVKVCPAGFSTVSSQNRILGCIQTDPSPSSSCQNAMLNCFDTYEGRLPSYEEAYVAYKRISGLGNIENSEWVGPAYYYNGEKSCNLIESGPNYELNKQNYDIYSTPYRCWLPASDELILTSPCWATKANAGFDQTGATVCGLTTTTLTGNTPVVGTGLWTIVSGTGGSFANANLHNTTFTGTAGSTYVLRWTISNSPCIASSDDVTVTFNINPTVANAGEDQHVCMTTSTTLAGNAPSIGIGSWSVVSGTATITTPTLQNSTVTGLVLGTSATLRWTISNSSCIASSDDVIIIAVETPPTCPSTVSDVDGNTYNNVLIGCQCWAAENLKTTKYNDGTAIPNVTDRAAWFSTPTGAYCDYDNIPSNSITYGRLYNWYAVDNNVSTKVASNGGRNLCPVGWHVPNVTDWTALNTEVGGYLVAGGMLKETGTTHWLTPNEGATDSVGFKALPAGYRSGGDAGSPRVFTGIYQWAFFAVSSNNPTPWDYMQGDYRINYLSSASSLQASNQHNGGYSVRCLKDW